MRPEQRERRFWRNVVKLDNGHWHWLGYRLDACDPTSPGLMTWHEGKKRYAVRIAWSLVYGHLADDERLYYACEDRECMNPAHYRAGSRRRDEEALPPCSARRARALVRLIRWRKAYAA